jgi:lactobin A/cerein 7B family class IIb bacteriocin
MQTLTIEQIDDVSGGVAPAIAYALWGLGGAIAGAIGGYIAGTNNTQTTTNTNVLICPAPPVQQ